MTQRITTNGRFLQRGAAVLRVRGATYGSFAARSDGFRFPTSDQVLGDFAAMAAAGLNTVRTYTVPPPDVVEAAVEHGLYLLVGLDYRDWRLESDTGRAARRRIRDSGLRAVEQAMTLLSGHPSVLAIAVGNEVPVDLVRLHGPDRVAADLGELVTAVHDADAAMLATYVSFPTTEFLEVEGLDIVSFNVFLEEQAPLQRYLDHLQLISGDRPLIVTELGLAADIHGVDAQADSLDWQLRAVDEVGCAGATVFSWTDEWAVDDEEVSGWGFGITAADRSPKPALDVVAAWAKSDTPGRLRERWPRISVIVCAYNEERTIHECLSSLAACDYPDLEVILCDDGSTDRTLEIARSFEFKILELPHGGLSRARNAGLEAATGEMVAYLDADAACHPDWPFYLALSLEDPALVATGGPNLPHPAAGFVERAVALSPGSPVEVLLSADRAEHVPGCNMAFRKEHLEAIGGFNPVYTSAGDDVDVCWKLLDRGHEIGFSPAAQVTHHRRGTVKGYLKQQRGYGRAEKLLSGPHAARFNRLGQAKWSGFVYGGSRILPSLLRPVVYSGYRGTAPFQPITRRRAEQVGAWASALLPLAVPLLVIGLLLAILSPWWLALPALVALLVIGYGVAVAGALRVDHHEPAPWRLRALVGLLHVLQPFVRAWGRITGSRAPTSAEAAIAWTGDRDDWLEKLRHTLEADGCAVQVAPPGKDWDLSATSGPFFVAAVTTAVAWKWEPRYRVSYRPRWWLLVFGGAALTALAIEPVLGLVAGGVVLGAVAVELAVLRSRVRRGLARTTQGAAL